MTCNLSDDDRANGTLCRSMNCDLCKASRLKIRRAQAWDALTIRMGSAPTETLEQWVEIIDSVSKGGVCGVERPVRKTLCQLPEGHGGSHMATVFWE